MGKTYAVDLWLYGNPGGGCRKTVHGSDWHYVDLGGVNFGDLYRWIDDLENPPQNEAEKTQDTAEPPG